MPNLVGIWKPEASQDEIQETITRQLQRIRMPGVAFTDHTLVIPGFGMALMDHGLLENGPQPARSQNGRFSLMLDGEISNTHDLRRRVRNQLSTRSLSTPELCLSLILQEGEDVVRLFNGLFCLTLYDQEQRRLTLITDRYAFRPIFCKVAPREVLFGSELKAICAADPTPRRIDEIGTFELFSYGAHFRERTWIQGYKRLEPAKIFSVSPAGVGERTYWTYKYQEKSPRLDQETYVTMFGTLLDRAVERSMQGSKRIGIFLSGGYDSRSVAASIRAPHLPIPAFTFGHAESRDVRFAAMLAQRLGMEHTALTDRGPYLFSNCPAIVWRTEGMLPFCQTTSMRWHAALKTKMDIILTGFLGEFSGSHTWPRLLLARSRKAAIPVIFDGILGARLRSVQRIFNPSFYRNGLDGLRERYDKSFEAIENDHPENVADCWRFIFLQPRSTYHAPSVDRHLFEARAPHMDNELCDFLLTIPPRSRLEQRVYKKMIAYRFPQVRDIPCTNSGLPINPHFVREYSAMVTRFVGRKALVPFQSWFRVQTPLGREFRDLNDDFRTEPRLVDDLLRPMLREGVFPQGIFDNESIEAIIDEHYQRDGKHYEVLALLISWGLAATFFLYEDVVEGPPKGLPSGPLKYACRAAASNPS